MSLALTFAAAEVATAMVKTTYSFDEAQAIAKVGDVIECTKAVTGEAFFTEGKEYEFIVGEMFYTDGVVTIRDNTDVETPPDHVAPGRIPLLDEFTFVARLTNEETAPASVPEPASVFPLSNDRMKELAEEGLKKLISEAHEEHSNLRDYRAYSNKFNGFDTDKPWDEMSDADKSAVLLAVHNGKRVQFYAPWTGGDEWMTVAEAVKLDSFNGEVAYRPAPPSWTMYTEAMDSVNKSIRELYDELDDLRGEDEDEFFVDFW